LEGAYLGKIFTGKVFIGVLFVRSWTPRPSILGKHAWFGRVILGDPFHHSQSPSPLSRHHASRNVFTARGFSGCPLALIRRI
jgi:hypothetical protein